jgi:hypothetical protein
MKNEPLNVKTKTKTKFDKLQFDLKQKGQKKNQDEIVNMLIDFFKEYNKLKSTNSSNANKEEVKK